jgi:hypothetical protein
MYQGRYDASYGLMLKGTGKGSFTAVLPTACGFLLEGEVRDIKPIKTDQGELLLVARNRAGIQAFRKAHPRSEKVSTTLAGLPVKKPGPNAGVGGQE